MDLIKNNKTPISLLIFMVALPQLSETIYTPALPNIASSLNISISLSQWTVSIYFIGFALGMLMWGSLSDFYGRRKIMLIGLMIYLVSSLACMLATDISILLFSRLIQAFGASVGSVVTLTIIRECYLGKDRLRIFAIIAIAMSMTPAIGPIIGGYINQLFNWRMNFAVLALLCVLVLVYAWFSLVETITSPQKRSAHLLSTLISFSKDKHILGSIIIVGSINGLYFSFFAEAPFIFLHVFKFSVSAYGWLGTFIAVAALFGSMFLKFINKHFPTETIIYTGLFMALGGSLLLVAGAAFLSSHVSSSSLLEILGIMLPYSVIVFGACGILIPSILSIALKNYQHCLGAAGAIFGLSYYLMISLLTGFMGFLHNGSLYSMPIYFLFLTIIILITFVCLIDKKAI